MPVRFTWDEPKRRRNRAVHGLDFERVPAVFAGPTLTIEDDRFHYPERRYMTLGLLDGLAFDHPHRDTRAHPCHLVPAGDPP